MISGAYAVETDEQKVKNIIVEASIGGAIYGIHGESGNDLLHAADSAMYNAKAEQTGICMATRTKS